MRLLVTGLVVVATIVSIDTALARGGGGRGGGGSGSHPTEGQRVSTGGAHGGFSFAPSNSLGAGGPVTYPGEGYVVDPRHPRKHRRHRITPED